MTSLGTGGAEDRKQREAEFHDAAAAEQPRSELWPKYYAITDASRDAYGKALLDACPDADILEYGCGAGSYAFYLAEHGARSVVGIDISPANIRAAAERARTAVRAAQLEFRVMDAEQLEFEDGSFDMICGTSILHHLDLDAALEEVRRTLRPGGSAHFIEPLGHNPAINLYRNRTPELRTPDEHPLRMSDLRTMGVYFGGVQTHFFHLLGLLAVPVRERRGFDSALHALDAADRWMFRIVPFTRRFAWQVLISLSRPMT